MTFAVAGAVAGGVLLFLLGMQGLASALKEAAGERLRGWLAWVTGSRLRGVLLGTGAGFLAHSSGATAMTVGFVHAGLLGLAAALPVLFGANVGTTLSMQLISLRLTDYALAAVAVGGVMFLAAPEGRVRTAGRGILGLGVLFLGMKITGESLAPFRDSLAPVLARIDGATWPGLLLGVAISTVVTGIVQSSGAVIGMTFVLAGTGVFQSLSQTYPIVLGAHIGTTVTAVIASIGTQPDARRAAYGNSAFNVFNALLGVAGARLLIPWLERTSPDLVHQTANAHTAVMVLATVVLLPFTPLLARMLRPLVRSREPDRPGSFLDPALLRTPEDAIVATIRELGRCAGLCDESYRLVAAALHSEEVGDLRRVARNENSVDEIKLSVRSFLSGLARGYLSRRQAIMAQALNRCAVELERVGDHVEHLGRLVREGRANVTEHFDKQTEQGVARMTQLAGRVVDHLVASFKDDAEDFEKGSWAVLDARNAYSRESAPVRADVQARLSRHEVPAKLLLAFGEYAATLDRIVRHCAVIAQEQRQPSFAIKRSKLGRAAGPHGGAVANDGLRGGRNDGRVAG